MATWDSWMRPRLRRQWGYQGEKVIPDAEKQALTPEELVARRGEELPDRDTAAIHAAVAASAPSDPSTAKAAQTTPLTRTPR